MKIILTDKLKACPCEELKKIHADVEFVQISHSKVLSYFNKDDVISIVGSRALISNCNTNEFANCKFMQLFSTGVDNIDSSEYRKKGITLSNAPGMYDETLAEYVLYMMLKYAKRYHKSLKHFWSKPLRNYHYITEIKGKTVGIMGVGNIGSKIASLLTPMGVNIVGYANRTKEKAPFSEIFHKDNINNFLEKCDYIINTLPHCDDTTELLDYTRFNQMKDTVVFINIGRESIYNKKDLVRFYADHENAVAILDIFELFPNPFSKFHRLNNIFITPRIAAISKESDENLKRLILENICLYLDGYTPNNVIN